MAEFGYLTGEESMVDGLANVTVIEGVTDVTKEARMPKKAKTVKVLVHKFHVNVPTDPTQSNVNDLTAVLSKYGEVEYAGSVMRHIPAPASANETVAV